jgi:aryl-alcohol dehydrogenase-like predicted oxidoreductase
VKYRILGKTDIVVSEVGLGTWQLAGDVWGKQSDAEYLNVIHTALDHGVNFLDTALDYGKGNSERLIGAALKQRNQEVVIATKVPPKCQKWGPQVHEAIDDYFTPDWIVECCEKSLRNLQRDYIDILLLHTWSVAWAHCTAWYDAMQRLKQEGKIRVIGISVRDRRPHDANVHVEAERVDVIEVVYNLFEQEPDYTLFPLAQKHQTGIIARCPFSSGTLSEKWKHDMIFPADDWRGIWPPQGWLDEQIEMTSQIESVVKDISLTVRKAALKFILNNSAVSVVIPGSSNPVHVIENANVSDSSELPEEFYYHVRQLWTSGSVHGVYNGGE